MRRGITGLGCQVDVSLRDAFLSLQACWFGSYLATGIQPARVGAGSPFTAPTDVYPTADGYIVLAVVNEKHWRIFCETLGLTGIAEDSRFVDNESRVTHVEVLRKIVSDALAARTTADWLSAFKSAQIPAGEVMEYEDIVADEQIQLNQMVIEFQHSGGFPVRTQGIPFWFDGDKADVGYISQELQPSAEDRFHLRAKFGVDFLNVDIVSDETSDETDQSLIRRCQARPVDSTYGQGPHRVRPVSHHRKMPVLVVWIHRFRGGFMSEDLPIVQSQISAAECHCNYLDAAIFSSRDFCTKVFKFASPRRYINLRSRPCNKAANVIQQSLPATNAVQDFGPGMNLRGRNEGGGGGTFGYFNSLREVQGQPVKQNVRGSRCEPLRVFTQHDRRATGFQFSDRFVDLRLRNAGDFRKTVRCLSVITQKPNINAGLVLRETKISQGRCQIRLRFHLITSFPRFACFVSCPM